MNKPDFNYNNKKHELIFSNIKNKIYAEDCGINRYKNCNFNDFILRESNSQNKGIRLRYKILREIKIMDFNFDFLMK